MTAPWLLAAALALPARAQADAAEAQTAAAFAKADALLAAQAGTDSRTTAALDAQIQALAPAVLRWGWRAVAPLSRRLAERRRPVKSRLYALSFLALTRDPLALPPLREVLLDRASPGELRAAAAEALPGLPVSRQPVRAALCAALAQDDLPAPAAGAALRQAAELGCDEAGVLELRARQGGLRPSGSAAQGTRCAIRALGASRPIAAGRALVRLLGFFPTGSDLRLEVLRALWSKRRDLPALRPEAGSALAGLLRSEDRADAVAAAVPLLAEAGGAQAVPLLRRLLGHPDAEVIAAAAEGLAQLQDFPSREELRALLSRVREDPRFAPRPGHAEPQGIVARLRAALRRLE